MPMTVPWWPWAMGTREKFGFFGAIGREGARVGTHFEGPADRVGTII